MKDRAVAIASQPRGGSRANPDWFLALLLVTVTFVVYLPLTQAGFIWDDDLWLMNNPAFRKAQSLSQFWFHPVTLDYFPLTSTTFWMEWRLWGNHPLGYHQVNVLLHSASAVLLWRVLRQLNCPGAWLAAAIFALHPVNVESVAWITERKNTLAMFFYLVSVLFYLRNEDMRRPAYWLSVLAFVLALLSKTAVVPLPLVLLGIARWQRGRIARRDVGRSVPFFVMAVVLGLVTVWFQHRTMGAEIIRTDSFAARLAGAGWAIWFYLWKLVWPVGLIAVYPRWGINAAAWWSYVPGFLALTIFVVAWMRRERWGKPVLFAFGYFVVMLGPVIGFLNISFMQYSLVADRYQYFSMIGPIALIAAGVTMAVEKWQGRWIRGGIYALLLLVLGGLTWRQAGAYQDSEALWRRTLAVNPNCWVGWDGLGTALNEKGQSDEAIKCFGDAVRLKPDYAEAHNNLGGALDKKGRVDEAIKQFEDAIRGKPNYPTAHYNLGIALTGKGRVEEALREFQEAIRLQPDLAGAHNDLGSVLLNKGQGTEAIRQFQEAIRLQPDYAEAHNNLGSALVTAGNIAEAIRQCQEAIRLTPNYAEPHFNIGNALLNQGQFAGAVSQFQEALRLKPDYGAVHYNFGLALLNNGQIAEAITQFQEAVRLRPDDAEAHYNLGNALFGKGQSDEAISQFKEAIRLKPDYVEAHNNLGVVFDNKGQLAEAILQFREAVRFRPGDGEAQKNLSNALGRQGQGK